MEDVEDKFPDLKIFDSQSNNRKWKALKKLGIFYVLSRNFICTTEAFRFLPVFGVWEDTQRNHEEFCRFI